MSADFDPSDLDLSDLPGIDPADTAALAAADLADEEHGVPVAGGADPGDTAPVDVRWDADPADLAEQALVVPGDDDDYR